MTGSIWPNDTFLDPQPPIDRASIGAVTCFVISPFSPEKHWDDIYNLIQEVCSRVGEPVGIVLNCFRADSIPSAGIIHPEIWKSILTADFIICDVTGQNGNVMMELGVAAAWKRKEHVIILRDRNDENPHLFDINPARHIEYDVSFSGLQKLMQDLFIVVSDVVSTIPFQTLPRHTVTLPFESSLTDGIDSRELYTEDLTHRRMLSDYLEFGAPLNYRYSWMSLGDLRLSRVHVRAEIKLTLDGPKLDPFMGIMVRGQHYFANFGHLVFVRKDGTVYLTMRENESGKYHDEQLGQIKDYDIRNFTSFDILMDDKELAIKVNEFEVVIKLSDLPFVFSAGRIIFIAGYCRMGIRNVLVEELEPPKLN